MHPPLPKPGMVFCIFWISHWQVFSYAHATFHGLEEADDDVSQESEYAEAPCALYGSQGRKKKEKEKKKRKKKKRDVRREKERTRKEREKKKEKEGEEESKLEIERGLEEDTLEERRFCYFFFISRRPNTSCIGKVGKTDLGLSYFLGEMDIFHINFASFSTVLLLW